LLHSSKSSNEKKEFNVDKKLNKLLEMIKDLTQKRFYGKVEITIRAGEIVLFRKEETIRPE